MHLEHYCHQLAIFLEVARRGSVTRAAEALILSQPAVSAQIKALERALGAPLLARDGRGIRLTEAGEMVADYAGRIFGLADELGVAIADLRNLATGELVIGASTTAGEYLLPEALGRFKRSCPGITIELRIANTQRIVEQICAFSLDLGFVGEEITDRRLLCVPYREDEIVPVVAADHPLAERLKVPAADLVAFGLIVREPGSATRATAERRLADLGLSPPILMEMGSNEAIKRAVAAGSGLALLSGTSVEPECRAGMLAVVDCPELVTRRQFWIIHQRDKRLAAAEAAFLAFVQRSEPAARGLPLASPTGVSA